MPPQHTEKTAIGLDANLAAALSYFVVPGVVFLLIEKENKFVRFHALQAVLLFAAFIVVDILLQVMVPILGFLVFLFFLLPVTFVLFLVLMFKAYQGEDFKLPLVGKMAADRI
jgi:uncharacterized membrane protein